MRKLLTYILLLFCLLVSGQDEFSLFNTCDNAASWWNGNVSTINNKIDTVFDENGNNDGVQTDTSKSPSLVDGSWLFDGDDDYVELSQTSDIGTVHSFSAWFKLDDLTLDNGVIAGGCSNNNYFLFVRGGLNKLYYHTGINYVNVAWSADTNWHHAVSVRDGTSVDFYIDGSKIGSTQTLASNNAINFKHCIGQRDGNLYFNGSIDEVMIYDYALSQSKIIELYNRCDTTGGVLDCEDCENKYGLDSSGNYYIK